MLTALKTDSQLVCTIIISLKSVIYKKIIKASLLMIINRVLTYVQAHNSMTLTCAVLFQLHLSVKGLKTTYLWALLSFYGLGISDGIFL